MTWNGRKRDEPGDKRWNTVEYNRPEVAKKRVRVVKIFARAKS